MKSWESVKDEPTVMTTLRGKHFIRNAMKVEMTNEGVMNVYDCNGMRFEKLNGWELEVFNNNDFDIACNLYYQYICQS
jgi:hypothetical protein